MMAFDQQLLESSHIKVPEDPAWEKRFLTLAYCQVQFEFGLLDCYYSKLNVGRLT